MCVSAPGRRPVGDDRRVGLASGAELRRRLGRRGGARASLFGAAIFALNRLCPRWRRFAAVQRDAFGSADRSRDLPWLIFLGHRPKEIICGLSGKLYYVTDAVVMTVSSAGLADMLLQTLESFNKEEHV